MIRSLLIANRGEIACRIIRTCRELGIRTVAVYSDADARARHVRLADEAIHIGAAPANDSYLVLENLIAAAHRAQVDAVHPGFGFLAESADFAAACTTAGLIFIGPSAEAIAAMGNKRAAKQLATTAGIPTIPGTTDATLTDDQLLQAARSIGYPLMVKAAAGGGGKGMRLVADPAALPEALTAARREAVQAFGSDELILEKAIHAPRHVEIQVVGDAHGTVIHLGERECSIQRRHQKVIEEAPSPVVDADLRARMGSTAVALARSIAYTSAGTVEFLLDGDGQFYFLEMNTRLQVEHPVTEMVTGIDLVAWQIAIAEGQPLPLAQDAITLTGHAIEARVYAENPANDFLPVTGEIVRWEPPTAVRVESGIETRDHVGIHYDPMLAKLIAHGDDRATAVRRLHRALETTVLLGLPNNLPFLRDVVAHPAFLSGDLSTDFIADHLAGWSLPEGDVELALVVVTLCQFQQQTAVAPTGGYWRNNPSQPLHYRYRIADELVDVALRPRPRQPDWFEVELDGARLTVEWIAAEDGRVTLGVDGHRQVVTAVDDPASGHWWVQTRRGVVELAVESLLPEPRPSAAAGGSLRAPMPGAVLAVLVGEGERVAEGQPLMKLEAMKMEHTIRTAASGVVEQIFYAAGDTVEADAQLLVIRED